MSVNLISQTVPILTKLATVQKQQHWIQGDLSLDLSSKIGRIFWCVIKHFTCLREFFYGVNLEKSKLNLHTLRTAILINKDPSQIALYNRAVQAFNLIAKRHQALEIKPADLIVPQKKMLDLAERVKVGTYNILFPQRAVPDPFSTEVGYSVDASGKLYENSNERMPIIMKNLKCADLDIVCLQEVVKTTFNQLKTAFSKDNPAYECDWTSHNHSGHGVGILYKKHKFTVLNRSENAHTYQVPDGKDPTKTNAKPRKELLLDLQDKSSKKIFRVVSCHLLDPRDFTDKGTHIRTVLAAAQKPAAYHVDRIVIAGDMNQSEWGDVGMSKAAVASEKNASAFKELIQAKFSVDGNYASTLYGKDKFDNGPVKSKDCHIDWVWESDFQPDPYPLSGLDVRGSDHLLVASTIK